VLTPTESVTYTPEGLERGLLGFLFELTFLVNHRYYTVYTSQGSDFTTKAMKIIKESLEPSSKSFRISKVF
jgi:hypothetical protein